MKKFVENNFFNLMSDDEVGKLLVELPPYLRNEVFKAVHGKIIEQMQFLSECQQNNNVLFLIGILKAIKYVTYEQNDIVYSINDHALQLFFVKSGEIILYNENEKPFKKYVEGEMFGDSDVLLG